MQPVLVIFDPRRDTKITSDASQNGIGSALTQRHGESWKPVAYAWRVLSETQERYSQIDKEAMAGVFGCERFHHFVYGRHVILETDHRPLIAISHKAIGEMPPRLQRFFLRLLKYDFRLQFIPGKRLVLADMLSRAPVSRPDTEDNDDVEVHAVQVLASLVSEATQARLSQETNNDCYLKCVIESIRNRPIGGQLTAFSKELTVVNGVLFEGCKTVIPTTMRPEILRRIHAGHMGLNKCKARARLVVFWPGMNTDIENFVSTCEVCKKYSYKQPSEPIMIRPTPEHA